MIEALFIALLAVGYLWLMLSSYRYVVGKKGARAVEGKTPAALVGAPYPWKIQSMITDTKVPLIELVLAVENWVEGRPLGAQSGRCQACGQVGPTHRTDTGVTVCFDCWEKMNLAITARCSGCGIVPPSLFRTNNGQRLCRGCWDEYCDLRTQLP